MLRNERPLAQATRKQPMTPLPPGPILVAEPMLCGCALLGQFMNDDFGMAAPQAGSGRSHGVNRRAAARANCTQIGNILNAASL